MIGIVEVLVSTPRAMRGVSEDQVQVVAVTVDKSNHKVGCVRAGDGVGVGSHIVRRTDRI